MKEACERANGLIEEGNKKRSEHASFIPWACLRERPGHAVAKANSINPSRCAFLSLYLSFASYFPLEAGFDPIPCIPLAVSLVAGCT